MTYGPRLLVTLLLALTVSAGCSASNGVRVDDYNSVVTPKAHIDDSASITPQPGGREPDATAAYYGGYYERYGLGERFDESGWSREEIQAASFLHSSNIYFHFDSSALTSDAKEVLRQKAGRLKDFPQLSMLIAGHSDERGSDEYNILLGDRRARAAYNYLISLGVAPAQLGSASFGKRFPISQGNSEDAWSLNRRDEFMVYKP